MASGCKMKGDELAVFTDGKITRGQFYEWIEIRKFPRDMILKKKSDQKNRIRQLAVDIISSREAARAGFDKREDYKYLMEIARRDFIAGYYMKNMRESGSFSEEAVRVSMIRLIVKSYKIENNKRVDLGKAETDVEFEKRIAEAKSIIKELDEGKSFSDLAGKYSEDYTKNSGGDIGFITMDMRGENFGKSVFGLKEGQYTKEPVRDMDSVLVLKVEKKVTLTEKNIDGYIKDENMRNQMKARLSGKNARQVQEKLAKAPDVESHMERINAGPDAVLFKIGNEQFKVADLNKMIDFITKKTSGFRPKAHLINDSYKKGITERLFKEELMVREAKKTGLDKSEGFLKELEYFKDYNLGNYYKNETIMPLVKVTPDDVIKEYNINRDRMYSRTDRGGVKVPMNFNEIRERIQYMLINKKYSAEKEKWENELLSKYKFKINESKLEGD
jgi:hypothetical protein